MIKLKYFTNIHAKNTRIAFFYSSKIYTYADLYKSISSIHLEILKNSYRHHHLFSISFESDPISNLILLIALLELEKTVILSSKNNLYEHITPPCVQIIYKNKKFLYTSKSLSSYKYPTGIVLFTSGSSSYPKGVLLSLKSLFLSARTTLDFYDVTSSQIWGAHLSFDHIGGLMIPIRTLINNSHMEIPLEISSKGLWPYRRSIDLISLVPMQLSRLLRGGHSEHLRKISKIIVGGSPLDSSLHALARKKQLTISSTYGLTEYCSQVAAEDSNNHWKILDHLELKISPRKHILIKGPSLFRGYFYKKTFHSAPLDDEGYFHTEDTGEMKDGSLLILERRDLLFLSGGFNISPTEIEKALELHQHIVMAIVVPRPEKEFGSEIVAFYYSKSFLEQEMITSFLKKLLLFYQIPKAFHHLQIKDMPVQGKINRSYFKDKAIHI